MSLTAQDLHFAYKKGTEILGGIHVAAHTGEILSILAPNGNGKTTLLKCMGGLLPPASGTILLGGQDIAAMSPKVRAQHIAYVPQSYQSIFPIQVLDLVLSGRAPHTRFSYSQRDKEIAIEALASLGLETLAFRDVRTLSGGERQRVLLARALAQTPKVLLLDEPTASLDIKHQLQILDKISALKAERNLIILMSTHDLNLAAAYSDRIALIKCGHLIKAGSVADCLTAPHLLDVFGVHTQLTHSSGQTFVHLLKHQP